MESTATYARPELLQVADTVARDKGIDRDEVLEAMEQAIQKAGRSKYGQEYDIRAEIDRRNGEIRLLRFRAAPSCCPVKAFARANECAPISMTCGRSRAVRRFLCRAPIRNSWPSCL